MGFQRIHYQHPQLIKLNLFFHWIHNLLRDPGIPPLIPRIRKIRYHIRTLPAEKVISFTFRPEFIENKQNRLAIFL
jgi:hypothetical protein